MKKLFSLTITSLLLATSFSPANAATEKGWRYWGYFQAAPGSSTWNYALTGPAGSTPKDGAVEGWKFSFSSDTVDTGNPTLKPNFKATCAGVKPAAGTVRVAVIVDFGLRSIAPLGENVQQTIRQCVSVKAGTNGLEILNKVVPVRASAEGFVCGLANYPAKECSTEISTPKSLQKKK
jgi:hypothetical protein